MSIPSGSYTFGPEQATLTVHTGKGGAAAKAGHNLTIDVTDWSAELQIADDPAQTTVTLSADPRSLTVREGHGGMQTLGDDDKAGIAQTIDDEVLKGRPIAFASDTVASDGNGGPLRVSGRLTLYGNEVPVTFELTCADGETLTGTATLRQSDWGIKPYSTLFGTLKVLDDVRIDFAGQLGGA
jgi:polyisoprenoid-binding protein YceI